MEPYFIWRGDKAIAAEHGAGPWDPTMLHGGAPTALITRVVEDIPTPVPMRLTRLTIDLKRPVPVGELDIQTEVTREGRNIQTVDICLSANNKEVVRASALRVRAAEFDLPTEAMPASEDLTIPAAKGSALNGAGFNATVDTRELTPPPEGARRGVWFRIDRPFFDDIETTPLMRAAATGDYCNALGCPLDFNVWTFINADLTLHFARQPVGEWIRLASTGLMGPDGRGLAYGALADQQGVFGRAIQSLVIARR